MGLPSFARRLGALRPLLGASMIALLLSCGGGGGGEGGDPPEIIGVFTGVTDRMDFNWEGGGDGGVGAGADGDGGVGVGGDLGQFRKALVVVTYPDGRPVGNGSALTDEIRGMVTIKPGRTYDGSLYVELRGTADASYYEEGKDQFVPFPEGQVIRGWIPRITKNIGITPFTDAAVQLLTEGSTPERVTGVPTGAQISAANKVVLDVLNQQYPKALEVDDITRLPFIKSPTIAGGSISIDPRGRYGLVNGAFSKQAALFNASEPQPTLAAIRQLGADLRDGKLDGMNGAQPAVAADKRTYDPHSLTGELSSALAHQSFTFGDDLAKGVLPKVLNFGNTRYEGYLFDASLTPDGKAYDTVAGWVADNNRNRSLGQAIEKLPTVERTFGVYANMGHGSVFFKTNATKDKPSQMFAIGDNVNGELGLGSSTSTQGNAVELTFPPGLLPTHLAGGFAHTVARMNDGSVYAWGDNSWGQLGQGMDGAALPRSQTPLRVVLPAGALAVAATSTASYALLDDGRVFSWGSSLGFGLLGDGNKEGTRISPAQVMALSDVVQLAARDNDAIVLKRDGTVLTWGSHPVDPNGGFTPSDVTIPYNGGTPAPTAVAGIPQGTQIRKILTEQGLFNALAADGRVYAWGVHFDRTADAILPDVKADPVLGLPLVRDLMPGGFFGYGDRSFDRLTSLAIDYRGNTWKVRGRVAEQFDPANPAQQRRPRGQAPRPDCASCHLLLTDWPLTAPPPTSNTVCVPPPSIHGDPGDGSLIHQDTPCEQCHNPARTTPAPSFTNGWLNCLRPTNLPVRESPIAPPIVSNSCASAIPPGHVFTPPGTVCSSCHNSIVARPLSSLTPACAQPRSDELPAIAIKARVVSAFNDANGTIAAGSTTSDTTPMLQGTLSAAPLAGQLVRVFRNGAPLNTATPNGTSWSYPDSGAGNGSQAYSARVEAGSAFGPVENSYQFFIDTVPPGVIANVTGISDDISGPLAQDATTSDATPSVQGSLSAAVGAGESVRLLRNNTPITTFAVAGTTWSFTEPAPGLASGARYTYSAQVVDAAGNANTAGSGTRSVNINTTVPLPGATTTIATVNGVAPVSGFVPSNNDSTPTLAGTIGRTLNPGEVIRIFRDGTKLTDGITTPNASWIYTSPTLGTGTYSFSARIEQASNPAVFGLTSNAVNDPIDVTDPTQTATVTATTDVIPYNNTVGATPGSAVPGQTNDPSPAVRIQLNAALGTGESLRITRNGGTITPALAGCGANCFSFTDTSTGVSIPAPLAAVPNGALPIGVVYAARVVDSAGNPGPLGSLSFDFNYFICNQARATAASPSHLAISASSSPSLNCSQAGCHQTTSPATSAGNGTSAGTFVPVPRSAPTYWCRRPA